MRKEKQHDLSAIVNLKVTQIVNWRKERLGDLSFILNNPLIFSQIHEWLHNPSSTRQRDNISTWMKSLRERYQFNRIIIVNADCSVLLLVPEGPDILGPNDKRLIGEAMETKRLIFSDIYGSKIAKATRLSIVAPIIHPERNKGLSDGAFLLRIDPYEFLYPLIQSWPTLSPTAETLMVRREGNDVLFLNELRHRKNTALTLRYPIEEKTLIAARAARGEVGVVEGVDYRGVMVLAAIKPVPDSTWIVISKVDEEEVYAPVRKLFWIIVASGGVLIIAAGAGIGFIWRHQLAQFYLKQYESELENLALIRHFKPYQVCQ